MINNLSGLILGFRIIAQKVWVNITVAGTGTDPAPDPAPVPSH